MKLIFSAILMVLAPTAFADNKAPNNPPNWEKYRQSMLDISHQLGVTCIDCHNTQNYRDSSKKNFQMAKQHLEIVDMLNTKFKSSFADKVDCFVCHRGVLKPDYKEKPSKF